jgi:CHAT domain-containing protein/tetratricopeptide (TPR) repeat protein
VCSFAYNSTSILKHLFTSTCVDFCKRLLPHERCKSRFAVVGLLAAVLVFCAANVARSAEPTEPVTAKTLARAIALVENNKLDEAEQQLLVVLAAIDAKKLQQGEMQCLKALADIYRARGRTDGQARAISLRYRTLIDKQFANDRTRRNDYMDQSSGDLADILLAMDRAAEAEKYLQESLDRALKTVDADPQRAVGLLARLARLDDAQDDVGKSRQEWNRVVDLGLVISKKPDELKKSAALYPGFPADLSAAAMATDREPEAIGVLAQLQAAQREPAQRIKIQSTIASLSAEAGLYDQALQAFQVALNNQRKLESGSSGEADLLAAMAAIYNAKGQETEARAKWTEAATAYQHALEQTDRLSYASPQKMYLLNQLQIVNRQLGNYADAVDACKLLLDLRHATLGEDHRLTIAAKSDLGALYGALELYEPARPLLVDAVAYWRARKPAVTLQLARAVNDLAFIERGLGSFNEAKALFEEAVALREQKLPADHLQLADSHANLALVYSAKGDYSRAILEFDRASDIYRQHGKAADKALSTVLLNEAMAFKNQGQLAKAFQYLEEALAAYQRVFKSDAPGAVAYYNALTSLLIAQGQLDKAAQYSAQALNLCKANKLTNDSIFAAALHQAATIEYRKLLQSPTKDFGAAKKYWSEALAIQHARGQTPQEARTLNYLAKVAELENHSDSAEQMYRQALDVQSSVHAYPTIFFLTNCNLAEILHQNGKTEEAIRLLKDAVKALESPRAGTVGGETERADFFAQFASAFDLLVEWNLELGRTDEAFAYAERGRNRTFLDQLNLAGVDLRDTLKDANGLKLLARERELRAKFATLRAQSLALTQTASQKKAELDKLSSELDKVQTDYAQVLADIHNASPYYREQLSRDSQLGSMERVRAALGKLDSMMLLYYVGAKKSFLIVIDPAVEQPKMFPLEMPTNLAESMTVDAGPLNRPEMVKIVNLYLADLRDRAGGRGLGGVVQSPRGVMAAEKGTGLAQVLVPREVRDLVLKRAPKSVVIVPDGALNELPFEALLIESRPASKYLLDIFPPVAYAPSANILLNLIDRQSPPAKEVAALSVGNPKYDIAAKSAVPVGVKVEPVAATQGDPKDLANKVAQRSVRSISREAYLGLGGSLPLLPATSKECQRIAAALADEKVTVLESDQATERKVRENIAGRRFIHIAAHGLVDQQKDNLFGSIALTPPTGNVDSTEDDGFLSLNEIHFLPLSGCELAVLSACQTNVGPDRPLEAGSTLAQAFLAAGARRAVCSHWSVDDASTAELIGGFFERVAKDAQTKDNPIAYAKALHEAQRQVRNQPQWASPYYWAPFVLIGPPQ